MKKILLVLLLLLSYRVNALESIKIDNNDLVPKFDKNTKVYNYFTNKDNINIEVKNSKDEIVTGDGYYELNNTDKTIYIETSNNEKYKINVFKDYNKNRINDSYIKELNIKGYEINFDKNTHEYKINIGDEDNLLIDYELSNYDDYVVVSGNGNFNKSDNIIKVTLNNKDEYIIHALKTLSVSKVENNNEIKEMSNTKKEIVKLVIITISCILVFGFYYLIFINKKHLYV